MVEMILMVTALTVVLGLCTGLIHVLMRLDRVARSHLAEATTLGRLADRFRLDVRTADRAKAGEAQPNHLELTGHGGLVVDYLVRDGRILRTEHDGPRLVRQEAYRLPSNATPRFHVREEEGAVFVVLELERRPVLGGDGPLRRAEYLALLGRDARLTRRQEARR